MYRVCKGTPFEFVRRVVKQKIEQTLQERGFSINILFLLAMIKSAKEMEDYHAEEYVTSIISKYFSPAYKFFAAVRSEEQQH